MIDSVDKPLTSERVRKLRGNLVNLKPRLSTERV